MARKTGSHSEITGPRIREAALRLFARHGYAAVSMRQIAGEVGVQAGALYLYTPDKQTLLLDLLVAHMEGLLAAWDETERPGDPVGDLEALCRCHMRYNLANQDSLFISYMELRNLEPGNFAKIETYRAQWETALESVLKAGAKAKLFSLPDTKLATMALIAMLNGVNTWYREGGRLSYERIERIHWNMVRRAVGAKGFA